MKRPVILVVGVAVFVMATKLLFEDLLGLDVAPALTEWLSTSRGLSASIIVLLLAADVLLPIPSSLVMIMSGAVFGVWGGAALALAGSIGGEWLGFELARRYGVQAARRMVSEADLHRMRSFFDRYGTAAVVLTRPLPIAMETMSVVAGLSGMRRGTFVLASLAGTAPIVFVYAYAGAVSREAGSVVPAVVILITATAAGWMYYRARLSPGPSSAASRG